ncbi:MAG: LLM class F420-dependent oxidoreductase, partial [Actinomycetales bacterium]|nr:LLM class F420-dependent oxidoreductase [Actinomycetales bacterium]
MRIGFLAGYWASGPPKGVADVFAAADDLGLDSLWTSESYGSDAFTPLAWWGAATSRTRLGTAVAQLSARTPAATAMAAMTLDHLSGGRFVLGLGVSGPQVVEGWYGQRFDRPLERTREYVEIIRRVLRREGPLEFSGRQFTLPLPTPQAKALQANVRPLRADLPIHLAAQGPKNTALAAEIADGWLPAFFSPRLDAEYRRQLAEGFARRDDGARAASSFEVNVSLPVALGRDVEDAARLLAPQVALYVGGMGSAEANFHRAVLERLGHEDACARIAARWAAGDRAGAAAAVPVELVLDVALAGRPDQLAGQARRFDGTVATGLL